MWNRIQDELVQLGKLIVRVLLISLVRYWIYRLVLLNPAFSIKLDVILSNPKFLNVSLIGLRNTMILLTSMAVVTWWVQGTLARTIGFVGILSYWLVLFVGLTWWVIVLLLISFLIFVRIWNWQSPFRNLFVGVVLISDFFLLLVSLLPVYPHVVDLRSLFSLEQNVFMIVGDPAQLQQQQVNITLIRDGQRQQIAADKLLEAKLPVEDGDEVQFAGNGLTGQVFWELVFWDGTTAIFTPQSIFVVHVTRLTGEKFVNSPITVELKRGQVLMSTPRTELFQKFVQVIASKQAFFGRDVYLRQGDKLFVVTGWVDQSWSIPEGFLAASQQLRQEFTEHYVQQITAKFGRSLTTTRILEPLAYAKMLVVARYDSGSISANIQNYLKYQTLIAPFRAQQVEVTTPVNRFNTRLEAKLAVPSRLGAEERRKFGFLAL